MKGRGLSALQSYEAVLAVTVQSVALAAKLNALPSTSAVRDSADSEARDVLLCAQAAHLTVLEALEQLRMKLGGATEGPSVLSEALPAFRKLQRKRHKLTKRYRLRAARMEDDGKSITTAALGRSSSTLDAWVGPGTVDLVRDAVRSSPQTFFNLYCAQRSDNPSLLDPETFDDQALRPALIAELLFLQGLRARSAGPMSAFAPGDTRRRNTSKAVVDRRASKGRKLRYDVFEPLVHFAAPTSNAQLVDDRDEILANLRGKRPSAETAQNPEDIRFF